MEISWFSKSVSSWIKTNLESFYMHHMIWSISSQKHWVFDISRIILYVVHIWRKLLHCNITWFLNSICYDIILIGIRFKFDSILLTVWSPKDTRSHILWWLNDNRPWLWPSLTDSKTVKGAWFYCGCDGDRDQSEINWKFNHSEPSKVYAK